MPPPPHIHLFQLSVDKLVDNTGRSDISLGVIHLQVLLGGNFQVVRDVSSTTWVPKLRDLWQVTCPYPTPSVAPESYILAPTPTPGLRDRNPVMCGKNLAEATAVLRCPQWIDSRSPGIPESTEAPVPSMRQPNIYADLTGRLSSRFPQYQMRCGGCEDSCVTLFRVLDVQ